tara:strand:- start:4157 stop:6016 length:1860 start_codon:yes stop_codon:yes gene_type:complete
MAGLSGWQGRAPENNPAEELIRRMAEKLVRGPHEGHLLQQIGGVSTEHGALGVTPAAEGRNLARSGALMAATTGTIRWQEKELQDIAGAQGPAAALIEGYRRYGLDVLGHMRGAWSVALQDQAAGETLIAIDRMGIHSLCYALGANGEFVFSTVTDSVKLFPTLSATVTPQSVYNYLYYFVVPAPTTIYDSMKKLEPAQYVRYRKGRVSSGFYWHMPYTDQRKGDQDEWRARLWEVLDRSFNRILAETDRTYLGAFLSGGLDSSTVAGLMMKHNQQGKTFTIGFHEPKYDESGYARIVAEHFQTDHHELFLTPQDIFGVAEKIADIYDEPYGNTSAIPAYYCAKMAREKGVTSLLAGDGGDELFAGNERYVMMKKIEAYGLIPEPVRRYVLEPILSLPGMQRLPVASRAHRLARRYATPMPDRLYSYSFIAGVEPQEIFRPECREGLDPEMPLKLTRNTYHRHDQGHMLQRMMHLDLQITLADNDLRKVNQMCRLAGVEVHYPFLEDELVEFAAGIPVDVLLPGQKLRYFFKYAMKGFLPDATLRKKKHGFGLPFFAWVHKDRRLNDLVCDALNDFKKRKFLEEAFLDQVIRASRTPGDPGASLAWDICMLELWMNRHL